MGARHDSRQARPVGPLAGRLALALGSTAAALLALLAVEGVARVLDPHYLARTRGIFVYSRTFGWAGRPGAVARMGDGFIRLDERGYRSRRLAQPRRPELTRVVVLGDSIASGHGVSDEHPFPRQLHVRDNGLEVDNLAVEGYGPGQELLVLQHHGVREDPDVVLLAICLRNDLVDSVLPVALYDGVTPRPVFRIAGETLVVDDGPVRRSPPARALQWLSDHSQLFNRLSAFVPRSDDVAPAEGSWRQRKGEALRDPETAFRVMLADILEIRNVCRGNGVELLVATFPNGLSYAMRPEMQARLHRSLAAAGVWFVDVGARFDALGFTPRELALDDVGHLAARGHAVASDILEQEIASRADLRRGGGGSLTLAP